MANTQDEVFFRDEGDAWYRRNAAATDRADQPDRVLALLAQLETNARDQITSVCEVGCANGWRLARLGEALPGAVEAAGFDASAAAIAAGGARWPALDLRQATADAPPFARGFDLVIVSFVLHWIDRTRLARSVAAIDGLVKPGGYLLLADFLPDRPCRRPYHHRDDVALYTYKQDYSAAFTGLRLYQELARQTFGHADKGTSIAAAAEQERAMVALLHKPLGDE